jgi:hypothetical protein
MFVLIYVDDILITSSKPATISELLENLHIEFAVKDLGKLNFFLGIEVIPFYCGVLLSQHHYILNILTRTKIFVAKPETSPMAISTSLSAFEGRLFLDPTLYCSMLHKFNCTRQLHESLSSVAGVQVRGRIPQRIGFVKINF